MGEFFFFFVFVESKPLDAIRNIVCIDFTEDTENDSKSRVSNDWWIDLMNIECFYAMVFLFWYWNFPLLFLESYIF